MSWAKHPIPVGHPTDRTSLEPRGIVESGLATTARMERRLLNSTFAQALLERLEARSFYPGPGLGGHCIPIDPLYLSWTAKRKGFEPRFIELAAHVNAAMPHLVV